MNLLLTYRFSCRGGAGDVKFATRVRSLICSHFADKLHVQQLKDALKNELGYTDSLAKSKPDLMCAVVDTVLGDRHWKLTLKYVVGVLPGKPDLVIKRVD